MPALIMGVISARTVLHAKHSMSIKLRRSVSCIRDTWRDDPSEPLGYSLLKKEGASSAQQTRAKDSEQARCARRALMYFRATSPVLTGR